MINKLSAKSARLATACFVASAVFLVACSGGTESSDSTGKNDATLVEMDPLTINVNHIGGSGQHADEAIPPFQEVVTEETDGKVTFEDFYGGVLLGQDDQLRGIGDGRADMAMHVLAYDPQSMPVANALYGLATEPVPAFPHYSLAASAAVQHMALHNESYISDFEDSNLIVLGGNSGYMGYDLLCTEPFDTPEDVDGRRVRAPGSSWAQQAQALGMVPVDVENNELYEGLQRGVVDCAIVSTAQIGTQNLWDVASYVTPGVLAGNPGIAFIMNADQYESLPTEVQEIMQRAASELFEGWLSFGVSEYSRVAEEGVETHGLVFQDNTGWIDALSESNAQARENSILALEEAGIDDPEEFAAEYERQVDEWLAYLVEDLDYPYPDSEDAVSSYINYDADLVDTFIQDFVEESFN